MRRGKPAPETGTDFPQTICRPLPTDEVGHDEIAVHAGDPVDADLLGTDASALTNVRATTKTLGVHGVDHVEHAGEAFGTFMVEAWAAGVPVVQPRAGAFPELVEMTGGGVVYDGDTPQALAAALEPLLRDRKRARELGHHAREVTLREFNVETMAERMVKTYQSVSTAAVRE